MKTPIRELTVEQKIREMSLVDYIFAFGSITDQNPWVDDGGKRKSNPKYKKRIPFKLWPRQVEACNFIEENQIVLMPKSRQKGYSELAAERALKTLMAHEGIEGVAISISEEIAKYFLEKRIIPKYNELNKKFPGMFPQIVDKTKDKIVWEGGRIMKSIASSNTAAASMTLDFLIIDEAGGIDENRGKLSEETSLFKSILTNSMPALNQNPSAWAMIIGTSVPGSYYNTMVRRSYEAKNETNIKYFFIGWWHQPGRNKEWYLKEKETQGNDMPLQHPTDMEDFFYIKDGLVFPHFDHKDPGRHIYDFSIGKEFRRKIDEKVARYKPSWNNDFITSYDHGRNHPAVNIYSLFDKYNDILYVFDETFFHDGHGKDVEEINSAIDKKLKSMPRKPNIEIADGAIYNELGNESIGSIFRKLGRNFKKAKKHDEAASRELLSNRFRDNKIFIHPRCINTINQLRGYRWDPKSKGEKPIQYNDDAIDALRYLCSECRTEQYERKEEIPTGYIKTHQMKDEGLFLDTSFNQSWQAF